MALLDAYNFSELHDKAIADDIHLHLNASGW